MAQTRDELRETVIQALQAVRRNVEGIEITNTTKPIGQLGFESIEGLDLCLELEERLKCRIDEKLNPLVDDDRQCARTVGEIVEWLEIHAQLLEEVANE